LRLAYEGRVPGGADLVTYWFTKAADSLEAGRVQRVGLVATNSIRGGQNRKVLDRIRGIGVIFNAWSDEDWVLEGAAVRVSIVCFAKTFSGKRHLDAREVLEIYPDLTGRAEGSAAVDLTTAKRLAENAGVCFQGPVKVGSFDIPGDLARKWIALPINPNGKPNSDVLRPWSNGMDIVRRPSDTWIIDFSAAAPELGAAALYEAPFEYARTTIKPARDKNRDQGRRTKWWLLGRSGEDLRNATGPVRRYIATPRVAVHRLFVWMNKIVLPDSAVVAVTRDDDTTFGILHSRFHEKWSLGLCTWLGVGNDPRYTPSSTFETFPFPAGLSPNIPAEQYANDPRARRIAEAARELNRLRDHWLNPPELVNRIPEVVAGFPDRIVPVSKEAAETLKKRTLTQLYNERPAWLDHAHKALDAAVAVAYGWPEEITDEEALARLLALNLERSK
jgi:type II restriction/modification system DNA methylase subunit YeeA